MGSLLQISQPEQHKSSRNHQGAAVRSQTFICIAVTGDVLRRARGRRAHAKFVRLDSSFYLRLFRRFCNSNIIYHAPANWSPRLWPGPWHCEAAPLPLIILAGRTPGTAALIMHPRLATLKQRPTRHRRPLHFTSTPSHLFGPKGQLRVSWPGGVTSSLRQNHHIEESQHQHPARRRGGSLSFESLCAGNGIAFFPTSASLTVPLHIPFALTAFWKS